MKARSEAIALGLAADAAFAVGSAAHGAVRDFLADGRARRADKAELIEYLERALVEAHLEDFEATIAPEWHDPEPVDGDAVRREFRREAVAPFSWWQFVRRSRAAAAARMAADGWIGEETQRRLDSEEARYARACELWPGLEQNRAEDVLAALEDAFEDNEVPAFAIDCDGGVVTIVLVSGDADALPDQTVIRHGDGTFDFVARENTRALHRDSVLSNALAAAKEAFAIAPFIRAVQLVAVERRLGIVRKDKLVPLCLFRLLRGATSAKPRHRRRRPPTTGSIKQQLGHRPCSGSEDETQLRRGATGQATRAPLPLPRQSDSSREGRGAAQSHG